MVELNMPNCGAVCAIALNRAAELYNSNLNSLAKNMEQQLLGSRLVVIDTYNIVRGILSDPASKGINFT